MNLKLIYFLCLFYYDALGMNVNLLKYLNGEEYVVIDRLIQHASKEDLKVQHNLTFNHLKTYSQLNYTQAYKCISQIHKSYVLLDQDLFEISTNQFILMHQFKRLPKFIRIVTYLNTNIIFNAAKDGNAEIYAMTQLNKYTLIQTISHRNISDAVFFINKNDLYLIVVNYKPFQTENTILYAFTGKYFDEQQRISTLGAIEIVTFADNDSEIITILQDFPTRLVSSPVYEFKMGKLKKIQKIETAQACNIFTFNERNKQFVGIFDRKGNIKLYAWQGYQMMLVAEDALNTSFNSQLIMNSKQYPFLVISKSKELVVYDLLHNRFINFLYIGNILNLKSIQTIGAIYVNETNQGIIIIGTTYNDTLQISLWSSNLISNKMEKKLRNLNTNLLECFLTLEKNLYSFRKIMNISNNSILSSTKSKSMLLENVTLYNLTQNLDDVVNLAAILNSTIYNYNITGNLLVNGFVTLANGVNVKGDFIAPDSTLTILNNKFWTTSHWLSYSKHQIVDSFVSCGKITAKTLNIRFELLKINTPQLFQFIKTKNVVVPHFSVKSINGIIFHDIYLRSKPLQVNGFKLFEKVEIKHSKVNGSENINNLIAHLNIPNYTWNHIVKIQNLQVNKINNFQWMLFKNSLFRMGITKTIAGNLVFESVNFKNLMFSTIENLPTDKILLVSTNQKINSYIAANEVIVSENIITNFTNNLQLDHTATIFNDTIIKGLIHMDYVFIKNNLILGENMETLWFKMMDNEQPIINNESDLLQIYHGIVKIKGSLSIKNLNLLKSIRASSVILNYNSLYNKYWTKSKMQVTETHFEVLRGIIVPHLETKHLNNVEINNFIRNDAKITNNTNYYFSNVTINGNLILNKQYVHIPDLKKIDMDCVKTLGSFNISGKKDFQNLKIDHLVAINIDDFNLRDVLTKNISQKISGSKHFKKLIVYNNMKSTSRVSTKFINNILLKSLVTNSVYTHVKENLPSINFTKISVNNLYVTKFNNYHLSKFIFMKEKIRSTQTVNHLHTFKDIHIKNVFDVLYINYLSVNNIFQRQPNYCNNGNISGAIQFSGSTLLNNLMVKNINGINFFQIRNKFLFKKWNQKLLGNFSFFRLKTGNLVAPKINNINMVNLIDLSTEVIQSVLLNKDLNFLQLQNIKYLQGNLYCELYEALAKSKNIPPQFWNTVTIARNLTLWDNESKLNRIFNEIVYQNTTNLIKSYVNFTKHISATDVISNKNINGINLKEIFQDAVLVKSTEMQVVSGTKEFSQISTRNVECLQKSDLKTINNNNLQKIELSIINKNNELNVNQLNTTGKKLFFRGLKVKYLYVDSISGVNMKNLVHFNMSGSLLDAVLANATVNDLVLHNLNDLKLQHIIQQRILLKSNDQLLYGNYYFDNIILEHLESLHINHIKVKNIIFDDDKQVIDSSKKFLKKINIMGNAHIDIINGIQIMDFYKKAILLWNTNNIRSNLKIGSKTMMNGHLTTNYVNNYNIRNLVDIADSVSLQVNSQHLFQIFHKIENWMKENLKQIDNIPSEYLYIEKATEVQLSIPNAINAQVVTTPENVLIHVGIEKTGRYCGLPNSCKCLVQETVQISSKYSINTFMNKNIERVYSYVHDGKIIHFVTNTTSLNATCRLNDSAIINEMSTVTWSTSSGGALNMYGEIFGGYISDVKYFTINNTTFMVIGRYYDSILNTHHLDCLILKFTDRNTRFEVIQRIPIYGLWIVTLFESPQGIILILGGSKELGQDGSVNTNIYIFQELSEEFKLLQSLQSFECLSATEVILGVDSLIILASKHSNLLILKYQANDKNYQFYQNFQIDDQILSISTFSTQRFGLQDYYLCVVTDNSKYLIYSFHFIGGWILESNGKISGLQDLAPFSINDRIYLFGSSAKFSTLLTVIEYDSN